MFSVSAMLSGVVYVAGTGPRVLGGNPLHVFHCTYSTWASSIARKLPRLAAPFTSVRAMPSACLEEMSSMTPRRLRPISRVPSPSMKPRTSATQFSSPSESRWLVCGSSLDPRRGRGFALGPSDTPAIAHLVPRDAPALGLSPVLNDPRPSLCIALSSFCPLTMCPLRFHRISVEDALAFGWVNSIPALQGHFCADDDTPLLTMTEYPRALESRSV